jgi:hypothetical protein
LPGELSPLRPRVAVRIANIVNNNATSRVDRQILAAGKTAAWYRRIGRRYRACGTRPDRVSFELVDGKPHHPQRFAQTRFTLAFYRILRKGYRAHDEHGKHGQRDYQFEKRKAACRRNTAKPPAQAGRKMFTLKKRKLHVHLITTR